MSLASSTRRYLVDDGNASSLAARSRARRWETLNEKFPLLSEMRILDLGGRVSNWTAAPVCPSQVVILNIEDQPESFDRFEVIHGDACSPPSALRSEQFDLVYSNSVMEHVGGHYRRQQFADTVHRFGSRHWIQTPYRYFPIEPHWIFPGMQFLPLSTRSVISARWPLGWAHQLSNPPEGKAAHVTLAMEVELQSKTEMQHYFPDSSVIGERFARITKSLIAVKA
jgi:Methyltransferase domain